MNKNSIILACALLISGCQPLTASPQPTPQAIRLYLPTALRPWIDTFHTCADGLPQAGLVIDEGPGAVQAGGNPELSFRLGAPADLTAYAAAIGVETIDVIVHPDNPLASLSIADLRDIYTGRVRDWGEIGADLPAGQPVQVWSYPDGDNLREAFAGAVLNGQGYTQSAAHVPNPQAMQEAIAADPNAIGFIPHRWSDGKTKALAVEGSDKILKLPVLAIAKAEPQGPARQFLLCLQKKD